MFNIFMLTVILGELVTFWLFFLGDAWMAEVLDVSRLKSNSSTCK
jgi:hypothetical protein